MSTSRLEERFTNQVQTVSYGTTQTSIASGTTETKVTGFSVEVPAHPPPGLWYKIVIAGNRSTGTNGALATKIKLAGTAVLTLGVDANASGYFVIEANIVFTGVATQKCFGIFNQDTQDQDVVYAAGTVNCSEGAEMTVTFTQGNTSDATTIDAWYVQKWMQS